MVSKFFLITLYKTYVYLYYNVLTCYQNIITLTRQQYVIEYSPILVYND